MNKILYCLLIPAVSLFCFSSCNDDDDCIDAHNEDIQDIPNIVKGTFPADKLNPNIGEEIVFAPELFNPDGVTFEWTKDGTIIINEKKPYTATTYIYKVEKPSRTTIGLNLKKNNATVSLESEISSLPDLTRGFVALQNNRELAIYDQQADVLYSDCFSSLNPGASQVSNNIVATVWNDKLYLMSYTSTTNLNHLVVCDKNTLIVETSKQLGANLINFVPLNERYVLANGINDAYRLDLRTYQFLKLQRPSTSILNATIYNGKVLANTTYGTMSNVAYYNVEDILNADENTPITATSIEGTTQNKKSNIVVAKDGFAYTVCMIDNMHKLVKIDKSFQTEAIDLSFNTVKPTWSTLYFAGLVASPTENALFIPADDHSIYKYEIGNTASVSSPFIAAPGGTAKLYGAGVVAHPTNGNIYAIYSNYSETDKYTIVVYTSQGVKVKEIGCGNTVPQTLIFN